MVLHGIRWYCRLLHGIHWYFTLINLKLPQFSSSHLVYLDLFNYPLWISPRFPQDLPKIPPRFSQLAKNSCHSYLQQPRPGCPLGGIISNASNQSGFPTQQRHLSYCVERPSLRQWGGGELNLLHQLPVSEF